MACPSRFQAHPHLLNLAPPVSLPGPLNRPFSASDSVSTPPPVSEDRIPPRPAPHRRQATIVSVCVCASQTEPLRLPVGCSSSSCRPPCGCPVSTTPSTTPSRRRVIVVISLATHTLCVSSLCHTSPRPLISVSSCFDHSRFCCACMHRPPARRASCILICARAQLVEPVPPPPGPCDFCFSEELRAALLRLSLSHP